MKLSKEHITTLWMNEPRDVLYIDYDHNRREFTIFGEPIELDDIKTITDFLLNMIHESEK